MKVPLLRPMRPWPKGSQRFEGNEYVAGLNVVKVSVADIRIEHEAESFSDLFAFSTVPTSGFACLEFGQERDFHLAVKYPPIKGGNRRGLIADVDSLKFSLLDVGTDVY